MAIYIEDLLEDKEVWIAPKIDGKFFASCFVTSETPEISGSEESESSSP
jgi:hypothetical protein